MCEHIGDEAGPTIIAKLSLNITKNIFLKHFKFIFINTRIIRFL